MIKIENVKVYNIGRAVYSARNPLNSWSKSDSDIDGDILGEKDLELARKLYKAGTEHRKYLRQIFVTMDITCNHVFWAEFDTYKVGVTRNSCSKMHKIHVKPFEMDDFSHEGISKISGTTMGAFITVLEELESLRKRYNATNEKKYWRAMIELLPMGYNLRATITMNYENVISIINQRTGHKLDEWREFTGELMKLPYIEDIREDTE